MNWVTVIAAVVAIITGSCFLWRYLSRQRYVRTRASVTMSKVASAQPADAPNELFYPDIRVTYSAEGTDYTARNIAFTVSEDRHVIEEVCRRYPLASLHTGYFNPANPTVLIFKREFEWLGLGLLVAGVTLVAVMAQRMPLFPNAVLGIVGTCFVGFLLIEHVLSLLGDLRVAEQVQLELREARFEDVSGVDDNFITAREKELSNLGFALLARLASKVFERHGHGNLSSFLVSPDRKTLASIGHMWYRRRFCGLIPLNFLRIKAVHFDSWMSDNSTLTTGCDPTGLARSFPRDMHRSCVPEGTTIADTYREHLKALERLLAAKGITPKDFSCRDDCVSYVELQMEKLNATPFSCNQPANDRDDFDI